MFAINFIENLSIVNQMKSINESYHYKLTNLHIKVDQLIK